MNWLMLYAWQAEALVGSLMNQSCSAVVLANVTMRHNEAQGAGGGIFLTSATDYFNYCSEDMQEGVPCPTWQPRPMQLQGCMTACFCVAFHAASLSVHVGAVHTFP